MEKATVTTSEIETILLIGRKKDGGQIAVQGPLHNTELCLGLLETAKMHVVNYHNMLNVQQQTKKPKLLNPFSSLLNRQGKIR